MSLSKNFARGRSHLIFIAGLLSASAFIFWVESEEARRDLVRSSSSPVTGVSGTWQAEFGPFVNAEEAGRALDRMPLGQTRALIARAGSSIIVTAGPFKTREHAARFCGSPRPEVGPGCALRRD